MKRNAPLQVGSLMDAYFERYGLKEGVLEGLAVMSWNKVMGEPIVRRTREVSIKNKVLSVSLTSAPLRNELLMRREQIIKLINQEVGSEVVSDIVFR